jgi:hypothetical protein
MMTDHDGECELTFKLTDDEREVALQLPLVRRASYVGRYGWVTVRVGDEESLQAALEWMRRMTIRRLALGDESVVSALGDRVVWDFEYTAR